MRWLGRLLRMESSSASQVSGPPPTDELSPAELARLDQLVRGRIAEHEHARRAAEEANRAKARFLTNMSHELRTPMHAVLSYAKLGRDAASGEPREYFERIAERGEALMHMLNDLLDLSRLEAGSMTLELAPQQIVAVVRDALYASDALLRSKQLRAELVHAADAPRCNVLVDSVLMGKLFSNLLSNAVRYSAAGGLLQVVLTPASLQGSEQSVPGIEIAIVDQGIGIPEAELAMVFDKFVQSSKTRTNAGGTGLGLAICREIVDLHGGKIWATNNPGPGATLRVLLPIFEMSSGRGAV
jgi:signal transduction histidine kinase